MLMILGHCIQFGSGEAYLISGSFFDNILFKIIYSFHMPLFALISGYSFYWTRKRGRVEACKRQIKAILIPIAICSILESCIIALYEIISGEFELFTHFISSLRSFLGSFWFLWALLYCSAIILLFDAIKCRWLKYWAFGLFVPLSLVLPYDMGSPAIFKQTTYYIYPYFIVGYIFHEVLENRNNLLGFLKTHWKTFFLVNSITYILLLSVFSTQDYIYTTGIKLPLRNGSINILLQLGIDIFRWIIGLLGSVESFFILSHFTKNWNRSTVMREMEICGRRSLGYYILNSYTCIYLLPRMHFLKPNALYWIIETMLLIFIYRIIISIYIASIRLSERR